MTAEVELSRTDAKAMDKSSNATKPTTKKEGRPKRPRGHSARRNQRPILNRQHQPPLPPPHAMYPPLPPCGGPMFPHPPPMMAPPMPHPCVHGRQATCCHQMFLPHQQPPMPQWSHPHPMPHLPHPPQQMCLPPPNIPQAHLTPFGIVTTTTVDGTTFYHYPTPANEQNAASVEHQCQDPNEKQNDIIHQFAPGVMVRTDSFSTQSPNSSVSAPPDRHHFSSFPSFSTSASVCSSRCSSPFLASTDSSSATRDSGVVSTESTDDDTASLQDENSPDVKYEKMLQAIVEAAEDIFSDEGLQKDLYLLRQIRRTTRGQVSIKLVASIKAIKKITRDYKSVVLALRRSEKLEINQDGTKVKRKCPLPAKLPKCKENVALLATNLCEDADLEKVAAIFKEFGTIAQLRIVRPNAALPHYLHGYAAVVPHLGKVTCAVVEYEDPRCAAVAHKDLSEKESKMQVCLLGPKIKKSLRKQQDEKDKFEEIVTKHHQLASRHNSNDSTRSDCDSGIYEVSASGSLTNSPSSSDEIVAE